MLSDKNCIHVRYIAPKRANILDSSNVPLAYAKKSYRIFLKTTPSSFYHDLSHVSSLLRLTSKDYVSLKKNYDAQLIKQHPLLIRENIDYKTACSLLVQSAKFPEISIEEDQNRDYYHNASLSHLIGYLGSALLSDLKDGKLPYEKVAKCGLEKVFEPVLVGSYGIEKTEVNAKRENVRPIEETASTSGKDIKLTLNLKVQEGVEALLSEFQSAVGVVIEVNTGKIIALVSHPGYPHHLFGNGIPRTIWKNLVHNENGPLLNKATLGAYSPGSTFKMIVALAALEKNVITATTSFSCPGYMDIGRHRFHCHAWKSGGHGTLCLDHALSRSCDIYFYRVALLCGSKSILDMAKRLGFGASSGIELPERIAALPLPSTTKGQTLNLSIGQGNLLVNCMQLVRMTAALCNGGILVPLHLYQPLFKTETLKLNKKDLVSIQNGMFLCVNDERGTAHGAYLEDTPFCAKTGSTQVKRISKKQRLDGSYKKLAYKEKEHALTVAFYPARKPKYAICVLIEHGGSGGKVAAPVVRDIIKLLEDQKQ